MERRPRQLFPTGPSSTERVARLVVLAILGLLLPRVPTALASPGPQGRQGVAICPDGPGEMLEALSGDIREAVEALVQPGRKITFHTSPGFSANWRPENAGRALQKAAGSAGVDVIVALGDLMSAEALKRGASLGKPAVLVFFTDPEYVLPAGTRPPSHLAVVGARGRIAADLRTLASMAPEQQRGTLLVDEQTLRASPGLDARLAGAARTAGVVAEVEPLPEDVAGAVAGLPADARVVYVCPGHRLSAAQQGELFGALRERRLWGFSGDGHAGVDAGALAGQWPDLEERMARHAALCVVAFLDGEPPAADLGVFTVSPQLAIGGATAQAVGYDLSWKTAQSATIVGPEAAAAGGLEAPEDAAVGAGPGSEGALSLDEAVLRAVDHNLSFQADRALLEKQRQERNKTVTALLPQLSAGFGYFRMDDNEAIRSMESMPVDMTYADISLQQIIFSDPAISQLRAANRELQGAQQELEAARLNTAEETEKIYLACLSAAARYAVAQYNLEVTLENLALARRRVQVGAAGRQEVYRWQTQQAQSQRTILEARADLQKAMVLLNQVLGETDPGRVWRLEDQRPENLRGVFSVDRFQSLAGNQPGFEAFQDLMIRQALAASPEVQALEHMVEATRIVQGQVERRFYVPQASAGVTYWHRFQQTYLYPDYPAGWTDPTGELSFLPPQTRDHFMLNVSVSWPLIEGGGKVVDCRRNRAVLQRMEYLRGQSRLQVQTRMRDALIDAVRTGADIALARQASENAGQDFRLSQDAYGQGLSSLVELLDAQREMVVQRLNTVLTQYDYLRALVEVQRAASRMVALMTPQEVDDWMRSLEAGGPPRGAQKE